MTRRIECVIAITGFVVGGCGASAGFLRDATSINQHEYRQEVGAVRYQRSVDGSSSTGALFCAIPISGGVAPYKEAMAELHKHAALHPNEVLENLREDHGITAYLVFYCITTLTISADVIQLLPPGPSLLPTSPMPPNSQSDATSASPSGRGRTYSERPWRATDASGGPGLSEGPAVPSDSERPTEEPPSECDLVYAQLGQLIKPLDRIYPNATLLVPLPSRAKFVAACAAQDEDVLWCLRASYLKSHTDECKKGFENMPSKKLSLLFSVFLKDYE
jgi:hypothetical protein